MGGGVVLPKLCFLGEELGKDVKLPSFLNLEVLLLILSDEPFNFSRLELAEPVI